MNSVYKLAKALLLTDPARGWVYWPARSLASGAVDQESPSISYELLKVSASGFEQTGLLFFDTSDYMAGNFAMCVNEECGILPEQVVEIVMGGILMGAPSSCVDARRLH